VRIALSARTRTQTTVSSNERFFRELDVSDKWEWRALREGISTSKEGDFAAFEEIEKRERSLKLTKEKELKQRTKEIELSDAEETLKYLISIGGRIERGTGKHASPCARLIRWLGEKTGISEDRTANALKILSDQGRITIVESDYGFLVCLREHKKRARKTQRGKKKPSEEWKTRSDRRRPSYPVNPHTSSRH